MPNVFGPLLSLSATGTFGKTVFYYDTKYGARVRKVKGQFPSYGEAWEVNKEWFKKASARAKTLTAIQKNAWKYEYLDICDVWRDIYMGQQIALWNLSPTNDLSWPNIDCPIYTFPSGYIYLNAGYGVYSFGFSTKEIYVVKSKIAGFRWYNSDSINNPTEDDFIGESVHAHYSLDWPGDYKQYFHAKAYYFNGNLTGFQYVGELP
jgi:hypothetical protein